jgi:hypothetical protein
MHVKFGGHASMMPGRVRTLNPVQATVDDDGLAGHKGAVVAGKKADRASDIARSPDAFDGLLSGDFGEDSGVPGAAVG